MRWQCTKSRHHSASPSRQPMASEPGPSEEQDTHIEKISNEYLLPNPCHSDHRTEQI